MVGMSALFYSEESHSCDAESGRDVWQLRQGATTLRWTLFPVKVLLHGCTLHPCYDIHPSAIGAVRSTHQKTTRFSTEGPLRSSETNASLA